MKSQGERIGQRPQALAKKKLAEKNEKPRRTDRPAPAGAGYNTAVAILNV